MKNFALTILSATILVGAGGCSKYDDGPTISIIPRKDRVANTWIIEKAMEDGQDVTAQFDHYELYLANDGDAELTAKYTVFGVDYITDTDGTWNFENEQANIRFDYEDDDQDATYQILRLTEEEFWLRRTGDDLELRLAEK